MTLMPSLTVLSLDRSLRADQRYSTGTSLIRQRAIDSVDGELGPIWKPSLKTGKVLTKGLLMAR